MNARAIESRYQIEVKPGEVLVNRLQTRIQRFEETYMMSSAQMLAAIQQDNVRETEGISRWMQDYLVLGRILNGANG